MNSANGTNAHLALVTSAESAHTAMQTMMLVVASQPLRPRAQTLGRGIHEMPFSYTAGKALFVAVDSAGVVVAHEEASTVGEREGAIESLEDILNLVDCPVIAVAR